MASVKIYEGKFSAYRFYISSNAKIFFPVMKFFSIIIKILTKHRHYHFLASYYIAKGNDIISVLAPGLILPRPCTHFFIAHFSQSASYSTSLRSSPQCTAVTSVMQHEQATNNLTDRLTKQLINQLTDCLFRHATE
jgi:hypothetical protein